jgi:hypothetical protein
MQWAPASRAWSRVVILGPGRKQPWRSRTSFGGLLETKTERQG